MAEENVIEEGKERGGFFKFVEFLRKHCSFLFEIRSLFYFFWFIFFLGILWMAYGLLTNSFTQFYPWTDYFGQYVTMTYYFHDAWRNFFKTGYFELYSPSTYLGSDNIGSNSYYGLFDPFLFFCYLFPRSWIPQTFALATVLKGVVGAFSMRAYLKYLGVSERSARIGATAFAFNGYINFMVGFPSFVSMAFTIPLILYGIEMVIKEKKITWLAIGLALLGMISFFFLVVTCIFGVLYAMFRYFQTLSKRKGLDHLYVLLFGILGFVLGIMMSAWTLFPSLRESALSGRTTSIGKAYLDSLSSAFKGFDVQTVFELLFELVGRHSARELQALIGFFYPTIGYRYSPLMGGGYDAWTASLFCYTPFVLLTFVALLSSCKRKKVSHLIAWLLICYLLFTNFAYYFFYAFTGDGYGRWYIVLVPIIIYYGCQELDRLKEEPKWLVASGEGLAIFFSVLTWVLCVVTVRNKTFDNRLDGYWQTSYKVPYTYTYEGINRSFLWVIMLQILFVFLEALVILLWKNKKILKTILLASVFVETVLWGNVSFIDNHPWRVDDLKNSDGQVIGYGWNGGNAYRKEATEGSLYIKEKDPSYFRTFFERNPENNAAMSFGSNGTSTFHSLFNYEVNQLSLYLHANRATYRNTTYAYGEDYYSHSWSAYYGNKRLGADLGLGIKYYAVCNQGYGELEGMGDNVPWDATLVHGDKTSTLRFYKNETLDKMPFGHAVTKVYKQNASDPLCGYDAFFGENNVKEVLRNDQVFLDGAIVQDEDVDSFLEDLEDPSLNFEIAPNESTLFQNVSYQKICYKTDYDWWGRLEDGKRTGPGYFVTDATKTKRSIYGGAKYIADKEIVAFYPTAGEGTYFNEDPNGAYFAINFPFSSSNVNPYKTRVYLIGDTIDGKENVLLSYEYETISTYMKRKASSGTDALFGFYPKGRVKYICFNAKSSDFSGNSTDPLVTLPNNISVFMAERKNIESFVDSHQDDLQEVKHDKNTFTFKTSFEEKEVIVTPLGFDKGWHLYGEKDGVSIELPLYKLNGGFVGFIAPQGEVSYRLLYQTPYLKEGAVMASVAILLFGVTQIAGFVIVYRKKKKTLQN